MFNGLFSLFPLIHIYDVGKGPAQEHASLQTHLMNIYQTAAGDLVHQRKKDQLKKIRPK